MTEDEFRVFLRNTKEGQELKKKAMEAYRKSKEKEEKIPWIPVFLKNKPSSEKKEDK